MKGPHVSEAASSTPLHEETYQCMALVSGQWQLKGKLGFLRQMLNGFIRYNPNSTPLDMLQVENLLVF